MKHPVTDEAVHEYADRIRNSLPLGLVFPGKLSECDFTDQQREVIRKARTDRKIRIKQTKRPGPIVAVEKPRSGKIPIVTPALGLKIRPLTKLQKMLYLQSHRCFFCGVVLKEEDASIEHLMPLSRGGGRSEDNEVVCHKSLNETFGQMDLKRKIDFIIKQAGNFQCPRTTE